MLKVVIRNPKYPRDKDRAEELTKEQFAVVHDYIVDCLNSRRRQPNERVILAMLAEAGKPVRFRE